MKLSLITMLVALVEANLSELCANQKAGGRDCRLTKGQKNGCYGQVERRDQESALACWGLDQ